MDNENYKVAAIQMASGPNVSANLLEAKRLISMASKSEVKLVVLPENFAIMGMSEIDKVNIREQEGHGQIQAFLQEQALKHNIWIVGGTIPLVANDEKKFAPPVFYMTIQESKLFVMIKHTYSMYIFRRAMRDILSLKPSRRAMSAAFKIRHSASLV